MRIAQAALCDSLSIGYSFYSWSIRMFSSAQDMKNLFHDLDKIVTLRASEKEMPGAPPGNGNSRGGNRRRRCVHVLFLVLIMASCNCPRSRLKVSLRYIVMRGERKT